MDGIDNNKPVLSDDPSVTLTIRLIMQGKVRLLACKTQLLLILQIYIPKLTKLGLDLK